MGKEDINYLVKAMLAYPESVKTVALSRRDFVWALYPGTNELIYDNYNSLAVGWSPTISAGDAFCSIAMYTNHINFGFNRGTEIPDKQKLLVGDGTLYRYIQVSDRNDFPDAYITQLLEMAYENSQSRLKPGKKLTSGETIVKSIAPKKRRPL
jgi:hypothetical protein